MRHGRSYSAGDVVLDPACRSGSFLVRAYYRKRHLDARRPHRDLIGELFGCDIALYPAHLATLNLAAREINDEANYPRIARRNFFDFSTDQPFCQLPTPGNPGAHVPVMLPALDAVDGNPPYVRQEKVEKKDKARFGKMIGAAWPDLRLSGRSDLHCYFWPAAARLLKADGYFGFLTSSSWMDVEYGFALQGWMLRAKSESKRFSVHDLAADIWDAAELEDATPLAEWLDQRPECDSTANIPEERSAVLMDNPLFGDNAVYFGKGRKSHMAYQSRGQAELIAAVATLGVIGNVKIPETHSACVKMMKQVNERMGRVRKRFLELAQSRTGDERVRQQLMEVLERWFVLGRENGCAR
ncbi:MAG: Eco57I restriction-modification methylase domain-containing protein [Gemmataceae bacterium]